MEALLENLSKLAVMTNQTLVAFNTTEQTLQNQVKALQNATEIVADAVDKTSTLNGGDIAWVLIATCLVFIMTPGLGLFYAGLARTKNALSLMFVCMVSIAVVSFQWVFWGYSLAFSNTATNGFIGNLDNIVLHNVGLEPGANSDTIPESLFMIFQCMFAVITPALAFGATAERMRILPAIVFLFFWSTVVYSIICYWTWGSHGWLAEWGVMDYAGGLPVHCGSGAAAIAYCYLIGKRKDYKKHFDPHNVTFVFIGTFLLWFGWLGFNGGSSLGANARGANAMVCSHVAASIAGCIWVALDYWRTKKLSMIGFCTGAVAGLATVTPGCGFVTPCAAALYGLLGALCCNTAVTYKRKLKFDDALDVFAVHYVGGAIGLILTGFFATEKVTSLDGGSGKGAIDGNWKQVYIQIVGTVSVTLWSLIMTFILLKILNWIPGLRLRISEEEEINGVDTSEMGEVAYGFMYSADGNSMTLNQDAKSLVISEMLQSVSFAGQSLSLANDAIELPQGTAEKLNKNPSDDTIKV
jgi:Amt family ammonium transporter